MVRVCTCMCVSICTYAYMCTCVHTASYRDNVICYAETEENSSQDES